MNLTQIKCPYCHSEMIKAIKSYETKHKGTHHLHKSEQCNKIFLETKVIFLERLVKPINLITKVLQARQEEMGVNAEGIIQKTCAGIFTQEKYKHGITST